jgi:hypothetical protein
LWARRKLGVDDVINKCSGWYFGGGIAGDMLLGYFAGAALGRVLGGARGATAMCRNSFTAGTPVRTPDGLAPIESLAPGDLVLARDDKTGALAYRPINHVIVTADKQANDLRLDRNGADETIGVTSEHPFWLRGRGWTKAYRLAPGDLVFTQSGEWARVVSNTPRASREYVYNLDVADDHTFFVGEVGAWVHNCTTTLFHGTDVASARTLLGGAPLNAAKAAAGKIDGAPGFFLATHRDAATYFAMRRAPGAVLQYNFSATATTRLGAKGAVLRPIPAGGMRGGFPGQEFFVPPTAFRTFNSLMRSGHIVITPL